jgi:hypothetical protein
MTISVQSFHHFSFTAGDLEALATFYARFGFTIARRFDSIGPEELHNHWIAPATA